MYPPAKPRQIIAPFQVYLKERTLSHSFSTSNKGYPRCRIVRTKGCTTSDSFLCYLLRIATPINASKIKRLAALIQLHVKKPAQHALISPTTAEPFPMTSPATTEAPPITSPTITESRPVASLGTIPAELRRIIFSYCCSHHEADICPIPTDYEICDLLRDGRKLPKKPNLTAQSPLSSLISFNRYDPGWPAVALMGVSHQICDEVLPVLFGMNTWRFSYQWTPPTNAEQIRAFKQTCYFFQLQYSKYFRNISCQFNAQDVPQQYLVARLRKRTPEPDNVCDLMSGIHHKNLDLLVNEPMWEKIWRINQMHDLDRLHIGLGSLACPGGCCRTVVLKKFIKYWEPDMNYRLSKWGPTIIFKGWTGVRMFQGYERGEIYRVYIKGENRKLLAVYGLWSMKEVNNLLKHWLTRENRTAPKPSEEAANAFLAEMEVDRPFLE